MLRYLLAFLFLLVTSGGLFAQLSVSGIVIDAETDDRLIGAIVYLSDLKTGVAVDIQGNYQIKNLKPGTYLFEVSLIGYKSEIKKIKLTKDTTITFPLSAASKELSELIITGVTRSTEIRANPVIVQLLNKTEFQENASSNIIDALKVIPGIDQITTGASISKPIIRGLGYNRVISLNNGIRQEGQQWGDEHGIEMDEYSIDRIEIVKGPGSLMYGSDGIAGVVNFIGPKSPLNGEIKSEFTSNYQSNNNLIGNSLFNSGNKGGIQWSGRVSNKIAGDFQNKYDGKVFNSGFKEIDANASLGINRNWGHTYLNLSTYNNTLNLIEGERDSLGKFIYVNSLGEEAIAPLNNSIAYKNAFPYQQVNHLRAALNNYFILKKGTVNADFAFQNNKRKEFADPTNPDDIELFFDLNTINYSARYNFHAYRGWETSVGVGGMYQSNTNKGEEYLIPDYSLFDAGLFLFSQKTIRKLTFAGGVRFDNRLVNSNELRLDTLGQASGNLSSNLKFAGFKSNYNGISGSIGVSFIASEISTFKFNLSRGFRAPNMAELASNGRHEGTFRYEIGQQNLPSEISHQLDIAYFLNSDHVSFELTPFVNILSNYIYSSKLSSSLGGDSIPDPNDAAPAYKFTNGNAVLVGGEIYIDVHPHPLDWLHLANSFSFVNASQLNQPDSTKYLPFIPAPKYRAEIKAHFNAMGKSISNLHFKIAFDHYFAQNRVFSAYSTETKTPSYSLLSATIGTSIDLKQRREFLSIFLSAENITNVAYQSHLNRLKYAPINLATGRMGVFNMGRNISLKLVFKI